MHDDAASDDELVLPDFAGTEVLAVRLRVYLRRAGITRAIVPKANEPDLDDLPSEARKRLEVHLVEELGEVLALALRDARYSEGKLLFGDENPRDVVPLTSSFLH